MSIKGLQPGGDAYPGLHLLLEDGLLTVTLDRAERHNALDMTMIDSLGRCFGDLHHDASARAVILRGSGRNFCVGLDLKSWNDGTGMSAARSLALQSGVSRIIRRMRSCPQPIVALASGAAAGGGFSLLLASDVRFGTPDLRMNAAYVKVGLGGGDMGSSYFLPRLVGSSLAAELSLTGRFLAAERALRVGLLSDVVPPDALLETGRACAREMLELAPLSLRMTKEILNLNVDAPGLEAALALEDRQQVLLTTTADHREAVDAFIEKRPPAFIGK